MAKWDFSKIPADKAQEFLIAYQGLENKTALSILRKYHVTNHSCDKCIMDELDNELLTAIQNNKFPYERKTRKR